MVLRMKNMCSIILILMTFSVPLVRDWLATSEALYDVNCHFARNTEGKFMQGVNTMTMKDLARLLLHCHCTEE